MKNNKILAMAVSLGLCMGMLTGALTSEAEAKKNDPNQVVASTLDDGIFTPAKLKAGIEQEEYRLAKYDVINLILVGQSDVMNNSLSAGKGMDKIIIGVDGMVHIPYAGTVKLAGLTVDEARTLITAKLQKYLKITSDEVNVSLVEYGKRKVYVMGNVKEPGEKDMAVDSMNLYAAIANAGGVDNRGRSKHVSVIRQKDGGRLYYIESNLDAFVKQHDMTQNIALEDGDIVYVPDSGKVVFSEDIMPYINVYATYRALTKN